MKGPQTVFLAYVVCLTLLAGCSTGTHHTHEHDPVDDAQHQAEREAAIEYLIENFPTREETLRVRQCTTDRTGFDEFPEMPADYGPHILLTPVPGEPPVELPPEVDDAEIDCIFGLGLEDRYIPPWGQEAIRNADDS